MRVAIGDVVRVRQDKALGTVVAVTGYDGGTVHVHTDRRGSRMVTPAELEHVARARKPMASARSITALAFLTLSVVAAVLLSTAVYDLGGGLVLTVVVGFTSAAGISRVLLSLTNLRRPVRI